MPKIRSTSGHKVANSSKLRLTKRIVLGKKNPPFEGNISSFELVDKVLDTTPFHLATISKDGFYSSWNKASEEMFGYFKEEVVGKLKPSIFHRNDDDAKSVIEKAIKNGEFHGEMILVRRNGNHFSALLSVKVLYDAKGNVSGFLGSAIDLSKEKLIEKERDVSEEKHRHLFENSKDGIIYMDRIGTIIDLNKACKEISGYETSDFIGKCVFKLPFLLPKPEHKSLLTAFFEKNEIKPFELEMIHKNGSKIVVEVNLNSVKKGDSLKYFQVIIRDITARKSAQNALIQSENTYRAIFENTGTATMIVEEDESISHANDQFINMSGYSKDDVFNKKKWSEFFAEEDIEMMKKFHLMRRVNPYSAPRNYEARFVNKDGEIRNVFLTVAMIPGTKKSVGSILDITARKIVENELRASKKLFDDLVQGSPVAIYVINTDHKVVYWNKAMEDMTGLKADQIIGTTNHWKPFYKEPTQQMADMFIDGIKWEDILKIDRYKNMDIEESNIRKGIVCSKYFEDFYGGKKKWLRFKVKPLYDIQDKLVGAIETVEDITQSKEMSESLANRMREFQVLYKIYAGIRMVNPLGMVLEDIAKDLVLACDVIKSGRARITFDGKIYSTLKKSEGFVKSIEKSIRINGEKRGKVELGYIEEIDNESSFLLKHEKKVVDIIAETIGKHVQSREIMERYQKLVARSVTGIFILRDGLFQYVNPKFIRMFKLKKEDDAIGIPYEKLLPDFQCPLKLIKQSKLTSSHCTLKAPRNDGVMIDVEIFTQIIDYYGKRAILGTIQDVTRLREAQERQQNFNNELKIKIAEKTKDLQSANRRLQSLNELKDEFIAVTSHELRSPLTSVRGYLSFLVEEQMMNKIPQEAKDYLFRVYDNVEVLNNLINNILDVSRIEMGRIELHIKATDIVTLTKEVIANLSFQTNDRNLSINLINKLKTESLLVNIDNVRIRQVLRNILDNAVKFSPIGKDINVEIEMQGIGVQISIIDQGMGIRKSEIFSIFDKFKQGKNSQSQYRGGAGLGLFIAKRIMEMHNGMIWAESEINKGTVFRLQLPTE